MLQVSMQGTAELALMRWMKLRTFELLSRDALAILYVDRCDIWHSERSPGKSYLAKDNLIFG
jgi:hypothetical protein